MTIEEQFSIETYDNKNYLIVNHCIKNNDRRLLFHVRYKRKINMDGKDVAGYILYYCRYYLNKTHYKFEYVDKKSVAKLLLRFNKY